MLQLYSSTFGIVQMKSTIIGTSVLFVLIGVLTWFGNSQIQQGDFDLMYAQEFAGSIHRGTEPLTIISVGDIMLGRNVEVLRQKNGDDYPFLKIADFFKSADMVTANLEGPIPLVHMQTPSGSTRFSFQDSAPALLQENNIKMVSLANNHTFDYGESGYDNTASLLGKDSILVSGHPKSVDNRAVATAEINGEKISFISFNTIYNPAFDLAKAVSIVSDTKSREQSTIIINIHWGIEYATTSSKMQKDIGHALVDAGADIIIGSHPHVVEEMEIYKGKPIFYSLGNAVFDQYFSTETQHGLAVETTLAKKSIALHLFPFLSNKSQPEVLQGTDRSDWLTDFAAKSDPVYQSQIEKGAIVLPRFPNEVGTNASTSTSN